MTESNGKKKHRWKTIEELEDLVARRRPGHADFGSMIHHPYPQEQQNDDN
jgi:hypothetical protein